MIKVIVTRRTKDYMVSLVDNPKIWEAGTTKQIAIEKIASTLGLKEWELEIVETREEDKMLFLNEMRLNNRIDRDEM